MWIVDDIRRWGCRMAMLFVATLFAACDAEELVTVGELIIDEVTDNAIHCHFEVQGNASRDCGFCYATTKTMAESWEANKVIGTYGLRDVSGTIEGLEPATTYFVRGYVMTVRGRVYTNMVSVKTTLRIPQVGDNHYPEIDY